MNHRYWFFVAALLLVFAPAVAHGSARLVSVVSVSGNCLYGPTGPHVEAWDVEPGGTYKLTITDVFECGNGGTDATINVRVNSSSVGNTDLIAVNVGVGVYEFEYTMPEDGVCTFPIFYCTTPGDYFTGLFVVRSDGALYQAHLRAASFEAGCTNPTELLGPDCMTVPADDSSWGAIKALYRAGN